MGWLRQLKPDGFLVAIVAAAVLASFFPAVGPAGVALGWVTKVAIFLLFFLYGARLSPKEALQGLTHWRLHLVILAFTFVLFPLLGLALRVLSGPVLSPDLYAGLLYLCLVPSTVQSSIAFTSIAKGNVAGAIVSASASNLLGVFLTPLLVIGLMSTTGQATVSFDAVVDVMLQLLLPFVLGQMSRRWTAAFVSRHKSPLKLVDRGSIILVVYAAFSEGIQERMWSRTTPGQLLALTIVCVLLVGLLLLLTWVSSGWLGFDRQDRIAIQFCGTKKSLATGLPMAQVLFAGSAIGLLVLPLMIFHQAQLMACSVLAQRYGRAAGQR